MNPVQTGQYVNGEFKVFLAEMLKQLKGDDVALEDITTETPVGYIVREDEFVHENLAAAQAHATRNGYNTNNIYFRTATEVKRAIKQPLLRLMTLTFRLLPVLPTRLQNLRCLKFDTRTTRLIHFSLSLLGLAIQSQPTL